MRRARSEGDTKHITLDRNSYYKLLELKGRLKAATWAELVDKLVSMTEEYERRRYKPVY
ncbi:hypothetical protein J7J18_04950 [bacterium]|nr:hypothetical protein [bacterium]MCW3140593.1 hypothetical protein [Methanophagales archaeon]